VILLEITDDKMENPNIDDATQDEVTVGEVASKLREVKNLPKLSIFKMSKAENGLSRSYKKLSKVITVMPELNIFNKNILGCRRMKLQIY
jgi:hypothetical protein